MTSPVLNKNIRNMIKPPKGMKEYKMDPKERSYYYDQAMKNLDISVLYIILFSVRSYMTLF